MVLDDPRVSLINKHSIFASCLRTFGKKLTSSTSSLLAGSKVDGKKVGT